MCRTRDPTPHWHRFDWWRALLFFTRNLFETEGNQFVLLNRVHHFHQSDELNHVLKQNHVLYCNWTILHAFSTSRNRLAFRLFRKSLSDNDLIFFRKNPLKHLQHLFCLGQRKSQNESRIHFRIHQQQQQQVCVCVCMAYLRAVEMFHFFYCRHFPVPFYSLWRFLRGSRSLLHFSHKSDWQKHNCWGWDGKIGTMNDQWGELYRVKFL